MNKKKEDILLKISELCLNVREKLQNSPVKSLNCHALFSKSKFRLFHLKTEINLETAAKFIDIIDNETYSLKSIQNEILSYIDEISGMEYYRKELMLLIDQIQLILQVNHNLTDKIKNADTDYKSAEKELQNNIAVREEAYKNAVILYSLNVRQLNRI